MTKADFKKAIENDLEKQLISAASGGRVNVVLDLLGKGADINFQDDEKNIALSSYSVHGIEFYNHNWPKNKDPGREGKCGMTALMWTCHLHCILTAHTLIDAGADVTIANLKGETALHLAINGGEEELARKLIAKGADVNAQTAWGITPLMYALVNTAFSSGAHGSDAMLSLELLELGADPLLKTPDGHDAFYLARQIKVPPSFITAMEEAVERRKQQEHDAREAIVEAEHRKNRDILNANPVPKLRWKP